MTSWDVATCVGQVGGEANIRISHAPCTTPHRGDPAVTSLIADPTRACDTLTRIRLRTGPSDEKVVLLHWTGEDALPAPEFHVLMIESASRLFLAAAEFVGVLDYQAGRLVNELRVPYVQDFSWRRGCVVLRSELECLLFSPEGAVLGRVPVDPPWEERETPQGLEFRSEVAGTQLLRWPVV